MTYKGYRIVRAPHPTKVNHDREAYDILDGENVRKANISTVETCKHVIDTMLDYGFWAQIGVRNGG